MRRRLFAAALFVPALAFFGCGRNLDERLLRDAVQGDRRSVTDLIARGASVEALDANGWTPLLWASAHGNAGTVEALIDAGADTRVVSRKEGQGILILAARLNRVEVVSALLRRGISPKSRDAIGWTALMWASLKGRADVVSALLAAGDDVETRDSDKNTPLILAARQGRLETVKLLLAHGARKTDRNVEGETAADAAESSGYPEIAGLLKAR